MKRLITLTSSLLLITSSVLYGQLAIDQRKKFIVGSWSWCQCVAEFDSTGLCKGSNYSRYDWHFVFAANGTYYESQEGRKQMGKWKLTNAELTLDNDDKSGYISYPVTQPVTWINEDLFYVTGQEGTKGPLVFSYFRRRLAQQKMAMPPRSK
jgi:hypothetical protein